MSYTSVIPFNKGYESFVIVSSSVFAINGFMQAYKIYNDGTSDSVAPIAWWFSFFNNLFNFFYGLMIGNVCITASSSIGLAGAFTALLFYYMYIPKMEYKVLIS